MRLASQLKNLNNGGMTRDAELPLSVVVGLSSQEEQYCRLTVVHRNPTVAYRVAFADRSPGYERSWHGSSRLQRRPDIQGRIEELRIQMRQASTVALADLLHDWNDIATADPNELCRVERGNCRFCRGAGHAHQWRDEAEYADACEAALADDEKLPDFAGGVGFNPTLDPVESCPACYGRGVAEIYVADTRRLSEKGKKLYKGVERTKDGGLKILMHDQEVARQMIARMLGAFADAAKDRGVDVAETLRLIAERLPS